MTASVCPLLGCSNLNPSFVASLGGSSVSTIVAGRGYNVILLINNTAFDVTAVVDVTKPNGATAEWMMTALPADFSSIVEQCELQTVQVSAITYVDTSSGTAAAGTVAFNPDDGQFIAGQNLTCGQVIAITVAGTPPAVAATIGAY